MVWLRDIPGLDDALSTGRLSAREWEDLGDVDIIVAGSDRASPPDELSYATIELSTTIDESDVARSARRANLMRRAGVNARPFVGGQRIRADAVDLAERLSVTAILDRPDTA